MLRKSGETGFSLLEVLVVAALSIIVTAIAVPNALNALDAYRVRSSVENIYSQIGLARMRAVGDFAHSRLVCSTSTNSCHIEVQKEGGSYQQEGGDVYLNHGVSFGYGSVSNGAGNQSGNSPTQDLTIYFNSRGMPIDTNTPPGFVSDYVLYVQSSEYAHYYAIGISGNGKPSIYRYDTSSWTTEVN